MFLMGHLMEMKCVNCMGPRILSRELKQADLDGRDLYRECILKDDLTELLYGHTGGRRPQTGKDG